MSGMLEHLGAREKEVGELIARGDFAAVWVPAFQAKDIAIALEPHLGHLAPQQRDAGEPALARVVRTAWLLDAAGRRRQSRADRSRLRGVQDGGRRRARRIR